MKRLLPVLLAATLTILGAIAPAAHAATTALQLQMADKLLDFIDFKAQVRLGMETSTLPDALLDTRPDWKPLFKAAVAEELDHDMPVIDSMVGKSLADTFSDDEIRIGLKIISDPNLRLVYLAAQNGGRPPEVQIAKATEDALASPAGQAFANKLQTVNTVFQPLLVEVTATVVPGALRRFGEKAEALEVQKRAAAGYAPAK
jgi:hypothetical protein